MSFQIKPLTIPSANSMHLLALPLWLTPLHLTLVLAAAALLVVASKILVIWLQRWRLKAVLKERERLALDIHDTLAQSFAGLSFQLQAIQSETPPLAPQRHSIEIALAMVRSGHEEVRRSIAALRPAYLDDAAMIEALSKHADRLACGRHIKILTSVEGSAIELPIRTSDTIVRIGQEAISNAVRHANASTISISLAFDPDAVTLVVQDDGCGFSLEKSHVGLGLRGMEKRARDMQVNLAISSCNGSGTNVRATVRHNAHRTLRKHLEAALDFAIGE